MRETYMSGEFIADKDYGNGVIGPSEKDLEAANSDRRDTGMWGNLIRRWRRPVGVLTAATTFLAVEGAMAQQEFQAGDQVVVQFDANIRAGAGTNFADVGDVSEGQVYTILSIVKDTDGYDWYEIAVGKYVRGDKFKALEVVLTPFAPAPDATAPGTQAAEGSTTDTNTTATANPTEIATAVQNGELVATPDNSGFILVGNGDPAEDYFQQYYAVVAEALNAHPELLLPSIASGEMSDLTSNGTAVPFGLYTKNKLGEPITGNDITKQVFQYLFVARYKGFVEITTPNGYTALELVFEVKSKDGKSFNIVAPATVDHVKDASYLDFTMGTINDGNINHLSPDNVGTAERISDTMHGQAVGEDVVLEFINNADPIYGADAIAQETAVFASLENTANTGAPLSGINSPRLWTLYVDEDVVVA